MIDALKFVQGAISKHEQIADLKHFAIQALRIRAYNGTLALSCPIDFGVDCNPSAERFIKAIQNCEKSVSMSFTGKGNLTIKSGKFRATIPCLDQAPIDVRPEGSILSVNGELLVKGLKIVLPFVGDNAMHPWSNGTLWSNGSLFATNNISVIEFWLGFGPENPVNIPKTAVKELLRIGETPTQIQCATNSITFHFAGEKWLRSQLFDSSWPDLSKVLPQTSEGVYPIREELFEAIEKVKAFANESGRVELTENGIESVSDDFEKAAFEIENFNEKGVFDYRQIMLLQGLATHVNWKEYPKACPFFGDRLRGAIMGIRK